jgi:hypothetical protein
MRAHHGLGHDDNQTHVQQTIAIITSTSSRHRETVRLRLTGSLATDISNETREHLCPYQYRPPRFASPAALSVVLLISPLVRAVCPVGALPEREQAC